MLAIACAAVVARYSGRGPLIRLALPLVVIPPFLLMVASLIMPLYTDRYVLYGQIGTAMLAGAALDQLLRRARPVRAAMVVAVVGSVLALLPVALQLRPCPMW